jgi:predicted DNA-binding antitoxin AbrB/MazE fold protein
MASQTIKVVYENGVFRPLTLPEPSIKEGEQIDITLDHSLDHKLSPRQITELAASVFDGLSEEEIKEIEKIALDRSSFNRSSPI